MNYLNNKSLIVVSIILLLISTVYCKNQYVYSITQNSNLIVIDIENNKLLINQVIPVGDPNINIQYIYQETINNQPGSKFPILSLFCEKYPTTEGEIIFFTIDYNIDTNTCLNGTQIPLPPLQHPYYTEYESTPFSYTNSNIYLPVQFANCPTNNDSLIIFNWDLKNETFKLLNYSENNSNQPPYGAMNQTSSLYYVMVFDEKLESQIQVLDYSNGKSDGEKVGLFKFNTTVFNFLDVSDIYVTHNGVLIAINFNSTELSICTIDLQLLSCKQVFSMGINLLDNNFNLYNFDSVGNYVIISNGAVSHTTIIEYYYVNLSTFKIDFAYKTSNYYHMRKSLEQPNTRTDPGNQAAGSGGDNRRIATATGPAATKGSYTATLAPGKELSSTITSDLQEFYSTQAKE
ncbi:hypothetical protein ACTFIW_011220 [Dictyostelium discoideum]